MANEKRLDLIDRQALGIGRCNPDAFPVQNRGYCAGWNGVINLIEQAPTVDAVEVVRCKDCKNVQKDELFGTLWCNGTIVKGDYFCASGERKDI